MSEDQITLSKSDLQAMLDKAADSAIARAEKLQNVDTSQRPQVLAPRKKSRAGAGPHNIRSFDPRTKEFGSLTDREWLWNPSKITRCPCGEAEFAETQEYIGTFHIQEAMTPTVLRDGQMNIVATRDPWMTLDTMPEHLKRTEEKVAHINECKAAHIDHDALDTIAARQGVV